ncbi:POTRA domain-containing protein [Paraburkholderia sediminicola]|uniref:POTRA domain-containing protein n=1 Tax=Paraburkholderia sediminicola TaxID=458836 RepID=UPI0038BB4395
MRRLANRFRLRNALPAGPGDALNLADLDQDDAQINRLRCNQAAAQMLAGLGRR